MGRPFKENTRWGIWGLLVSQSFDGALESRLSPVVAGPVVHSRTGEYRNIVLLILLVALAAVCSCAYIYAKHLNGPPIRSDGFGYYAYLPSIFVDHNLELGPALHNMPQGTTSFEFGINPAKETGRYFDKYAIGTAILQSPFFLLAHAVAGVTGESRTGYSTPYQIANTFSAIVYLCVGMFFLYRALRTRQSEVVSLCVVAVSVLATNVFHYATYDASFSHVYQFALTSLLLYLVLVARAQGQALPLRMIVALGVVTGLIALTRMTNIVFSLLPAALLVERWVQYRSTRVFLGHSLFAGGLALCVLFPQFLYWKLSTGHWLVNAYFEVGEDAKFYWARPELTNFLFSVRKGAFFWTPLLALALLGLPSLVRRMGWLGWAIVLVLCIHVYVCASWYCWPFGGSFGSRPMVDVMPLFALPMGMVLERLWESRRGGIMATACITFTMLNLVLMYAYWRGFVPFDGADIATLISLPRHLFNGY